jgi:hypothetical protein
MYLKTRCVEWGGTINGSGYGVVKVNKKQFYVHRLIYSAVHGKIPGRSSGLCLDHLCENRACVNPNHLEMVSLGENVLRGGGIAAVNARKKKCTICGSDYEIMAENFRRCRRCARRLGREFYHRHRDKINSKRLARRLKIKMENVCKEY